MKILLVDDNKKINETIKEFLEIKGYEVYSSDNGCNALEIIKKKVFDLYIIDIHLPKINGLEIVKYIRNKDLKAPIIMVTASIEIENFITAFENGCNEYIKKPFHLAELEIRINKLLLKNNITNIIKLKENISFDLFNEELFIENKLISLRTKEKRLLTILVKNLNTTVSSEKIISYVWENKIKKNYPLRQLVSGLKSKIEPIKNNLKVITRVGYRLEIEK